MSGLLGHAWKALCEPNPEVKLDLVARIGGDLHSAPLGSPPEASAEEWAGVPGRPAEPELVPPGNLARRSVGRGERRAALIHAVTHIEFTAINLALDAACRFPGMPQEFYRDWLRVAVEEAEHFLLLRGRLRADGCDYGDFPAHGGLWDMASRTEGDLLERMAMVPRVLEARGLDVTPGMMKRFADAGDRPTASVLGRILADEIGHVRAGTCWYRYLCADRGLAPEATFFELLGRYLGGEVRCPMHREARREAGFSESELDRLEQLCRTS